MLRSAGERWDVNRSNADVAIMALALRSLLCPSDFLLDKVVSVKRSLFIDSAAELPRFAPGSGGQFRGVGGLTMLGIGPEEPTGVVPMCRVPGWTSDEKLVRFEQWWRRDEPVMRDDLRVSREFLIREVANTDGVHIDRVLDADYHQLTKPPAGWTLRDAAGNDLSLQGVAQACIRQIAWEVDRTITVLLAVKRLDTSARSARSAAAQKTSERGAE